MTFRLFSKGTRRKKRKGVKNRKLKEQLLESEGESLDEKLCAGYGFIPEEFFAALQALDAVSDYNTGNTELVRINEYSHLELSLKNSFSRNYDYLEIIGHKDGLTFKYISSNEKDRSDSKQIGPDIQIRSKQDFKSFGKVLAEYEEFGTLFGNRTITSAVNRMKEEQPDIYYLLLGMLPNESGVKVHFPQVRYRDLYR